MFHDEYDKYSLLEKINFESPFLSVRVPSLFTKKASKVLAFLYFG